MFGSGGKVITEITGFLNYPVHLSVQLDGKFLVSMGQCVCPPRSKGGSIVVRFKRDGSLDRSFGTNGSASAGRIFITAMALATDGKVVVAGYVPPPKQDNDSNYGVARLDAHGRLDRSFSGDGVVSADLKGVRGGDNATSVSVGSDGSILVGGRATYSSSGLDTTAFALFTPSGEVDKRFSGDGWATPLLKRGGKIPLVGGHGEVVRTITQSDGKIVAAIRDEGDPGFYLARLNADGTLDSTFSGHGFTVTHFAGPTDGVQHSDLISSMAMDARGNLIAVGQSLALFKPGSVEGYYLFAVVRYTPDGKLDRSFSGDGRLTENFPGGQGASDVAIQPDGKIVVVGSTKDDFALVRYS
jgi:uncharacterized delta-60 repeat protein